MEVVYVLISLGGLVQSHKNEQSTCSSEISHATKIKIQQLYKFKITGMTC